MFGTHWVAALAASIIDLSRDIDSYFFSHFGSETSFTPCEIHSIFLLFLMIICFPSHVYDLFVAVFVANPCHCYYGRLNWPL